MSKKLIGLIFIVVTLGILVAALVYRPSVNTPRQAPSNSYQTPVTAED